ncbi:MAG TPA: folate-binding protein [Beijerinckiaceae bacterium]|jgi:folate-binding protein YgfZ
MPVTPRPDRGAVRVSGPEAKGFLDGLLTCAIDKVKPESARFGALLTPQGKILFDFLVIEAAEADGGGYLFDVARAYAPGFAKRLGFYKLRAKVTVEDLSETLGVLVGWDGAERPDEATALAFADPREPALGWRAFVPREGLDTDEGGTVAYDAHRVRLGVPEGGRDFLFGDAFPHEALMDQLGGVDFDKGCYVGQEVVSRMQHRGTARTRIVPLHYPEGFATEPGAPVTAGDKPLGTAGTGVSGHDGAPGTGLALLRLDRLADALTEGRTILAGGLPARLAPKPAFVRFPYPNEAATPAA